MALHAYPSLVLVFFACLIFSSYAYQFNVGGRHGWITNPSENYNHWAERMRFQVNDTLLFKYNKGSDSVLLVNKDDYEKCQTDKPIVTMDNGNSIFKFDKSGPFYFISGNKEHCENCQKIIIVVLAIRNNQTLPSPVGQAPPASQPSSATPSLSPTGSSGPTSDSTPTDIHSPTISPHHSSAVSAFTTTFMLVSIVSIVISVPLSGFIHAF